MFQHVSVKIVNRESFFPRELRFRGTRTYRTALRACVHTWHPQTLTRSKAELPSKLGTNILISSTTVIVIRNPEKMTLFSSRQGHSSLKLCQNEGFFEEKCTQWPLIYFYLWIILRENEGFSKIWDILHEIYLTVLLFITIQQGYDIYIHRQRSDCSEIPKNSSQNLQLKKHHTEYIDHGYHHHFKDFSNFSHVTWDLRLFFD